MLSTHTANQQIKSLINTIAIIGILGAAFLLSILTFTWGWPEESNRWYYVYTIFLLSLTIVFNYLNRTTLAKYLVSYIPILFCFVISIVNKKIGPIYINDYYVTRVVILAVSIIPLLIFKYNEYYHLLATALPCLLSLIFFDKIHELFQVGIFDTGYQDETYFLTNYVMMMSYLAMNGFLYSLKKKNDLYVEELYNNSNKVEEQNIQLHELNFEVENKNRIISNQNKQLKEFSEKLKMKVLKRTSELTKLNQELAEQNVKMEQFTFITAHNLKSPVVQIKGLLNLLNYENGIPKSTASLLKKINTSCLNLEEVISDLNKILNIKNNSHIFEKINLSELADHIIASLKNEVKKKNISIVRDYHAYIEFYSIKAFIYSILFNLINNAVKYSDEEKEKSEILIHMEIKDEKLSITIKDNGVGFDQQLAGEKIFQLYQRFNTSIHGKGIGLFLVKTQLEMLDGEINVKSAEHIGTQFEISIPNLHI